MVLYIILYNMTEYTISINNKKIFEFYKNNPHLNIETVNLWLQDIILKLTENMSSTMQSTITGEILSTVQKQDIHIADLREKLIYMTNNVSSIKNDTTCIVSKVENISDIKSQLNDIIQNIHSLKSDINNNISVKFLDFKNEYITGVKSIISENKNKQHEDILKLIVNNSNDLIDKTRLLLNDTIAKDMCEYNRNMSSIIEKNNSIFVDKTKLLFNEGQEKYSGHVDSSLKIFQTSLSGELKNLLKNNNDFDNFNDFIKTFDNKCGTLFQNIQQPVYNMLTASEERIQNNLISLKENVLVTQTKNETTMNELSTYLRKFNNSSNKGSYGETELETILNKMYPSGEVVNCSAIKASGDILLKRDNMNTIMMENKVYDRNVTHDEVDKFIRDATESKTHSIFLSQNTGISRKKNFQIDFHDGLILVYIHCVKYSQEKIQLAIDIIDSLSGKMLEIDSDGEPDNILSKSLLDEINSEYISFTKQTDEIILNSKDYLKKLISNIENLRLSSLNKYLSSKYASNNKVGYTCELCNIFQTNTKKSLSAHVRACKNRICTDTQELTNIV